MPAVKACAFFIRRFRRLSQIIFEGGLLGAGKVTWAARMFFIRRFRRLSQIIFEGGLFGVGKVFSQAETLDPSDPSDPSDQATGFA
jgi:hypothetical protein